MARILVVDDDPGIRAAVRRMLAPLGHEVDEAENGNNAIRAYQRCPADFVLCDLFMPEKCGIEVLCELPRAYPEARVVAMSGGGFGGKLDMLPTALAHRAASILYKPFEQVDLLRAIHQASSAILAHGRNHSAPA